MTLPVMGADPGDLRVSTRMVDARKPKSGRSHQGYSGDP
jgi:hypothetical protein